MPAGDEQPDQGPCDRVAHQPRLMREKADHERRLGESEAEIGAERPRWLRIVIPARLGMMAPTTGIRVGSTIVARTKTVQIAAASKRQGPSGQQGEDGRRRRQRPSQIVEHLPAADRRNCATLPILARRRGPRPKIHGSKLPVAARPAMVAQGGDVVAGGKLLDDLDVGGETGAREDALEQIVAEQRRIRHTAGERGLEGIDVVDALAGIGAFAEQILVHVGDGGGIGIDAAHAGEDALEQRALAADRQRRRDPRLQHRIAFDDPAGAGVEARPVERMRHLADQPAHRVARQSRVGVERDDVANISGHDAGGCAVDARTWCRSRRAAAGSARAACRACAPSRSIVLRLRSRLAGDGAAGSGRRRVPGRGAG